MKRVAGSSNAPEAKAAGSPRSRLTSGHVGDGNETARLTSRKNRSCEVKLFSAARTFFARFSAFSYLLLRVSPPPPFGSFARLHLSLSSRPPTRPSIQPH